MTDMSTCPDCGGDVEPEVIGNFRDWICQSCGLVVGGGEVIEHVEAPEPEGEIDEV